MNKTYGLLALVALAVLGTVLVLNPPRLVIDVHDNGAGSQGNCGEAKTEPDSKVVAASQRSPLVSPNLLKDEADMAEMVAGQRFFLRAFQTEPLARRVERIAIPHAGGGHFGGDDRMRNLIFHGGDDPLGQRAGSRAGAMSGRCAAPA